VSSRAIDKGKSGKVTRVFPKLGQGVVEGVGMRTKHQKPRREGQAGQIIEKQHPIHAAKSRSRNKLWNSIIQDKQKEYV
jgi:ribosomal protein L24